MLRPEKLAYADIVALLDQGSGGEAASLLKVIFDSARDNASIIAAWLASPNKESEAVYRDKRGDGRTLQTDRAPTGPEVRPDQCPPGVRSGVRPPAIS